jgi:hypothetical protein
MKIIDGEYIIKFYCLYSHSIKLMCPFFRIFICFQSKLDPNNGLVEQILEVPNEDMILDKICNHKLENGPKMHGFSVELADEDGEFIVETSFSDKTLIFF